MVFIAASVVLPAITPFYNLVPGSTAAVKQRRPRLVFSKNPNLLGLSEVAVPVAVDEYGAAIRMTVTSRIPLEKRTYGMGAPRWDGEDPLDVHVRSDYTETADVHQNVAGGILKDIPFPIAVKVEQGNKVGGWRRRRCIRGRWRRCRSRRRCRAGCRRRCRAGRR